MHKRSEPDIKSLIAKMLIIGFDDECITAQSSIGRQIRRYGLGGVILFDRFFRDRDRVKNIRNPQQLKALTSQLQELSSLPLIIGLDQEGGRVERLKASCGFTATPSAAELAKKGKESARNAYDTLAAMLSEHGINCDFAPSVDLALNPENSVIVGMERSYGKKPEQVALFASAFSDALRSHGVISVLKHFPGHGSSREDSHEGFADVTDTWQETELEPYRRMIAEGKAQMIMTAHVFNRHLDPDHPATLSRRVNTELLRGKLGFTGVIVSDDLQMEAIRAHYSLEEAVTLAVNAGVDMLLFGNQLGFNDVEEVIETIYKQVVSGAIPLSTIEASVERIDALKRRHLQAEKREGA